jgi:cell division protein FtsN
MQNKHSSEAKKSSFLWIIIIVAVLLAGAIVIFLKYMPTRQPQVPAAVVARGKIPPPPPSPAAESQTGASTAVESAPTAGPDGSGDTSAARGHSDPGSPEAVSAAADSRESIPEMKSETAAPAHEGASAETGQEPVDDGRQAGEAGSSEARVSAAGPGDERLEATPADEPPDAGHETAASPAPYGTVASPLPDRPAAEAEPAQVSSPSSAPEAAGQYTIQVGAYRARDNADRQAAKLLKKGLDAYIYEKSAKGQRAWYFVRFGGFEDFGSADKALTAFKEKEGMDGAVVRTSSK